MTFVDNLLTSTGNPQAHGGAIAGNGGSIVIRDAFFLRNGGEGVYVGGAINIFGGTLSVDRAAFVGNFAFAPGSGAAIALAGLNTISAVVTNSTFKDNYVDTQHSGEGGGIFVNSAFSPTSLIANNLTFSGNIAAFGGAISNHGQFAAATVTVSNSILQDPYDEIYSTASNATTTVDHSLIDGGCPVGATCSTVSASDPLLGILQYNGGFAPTMMPAANSPAIGAGANCEDHDQRNIARPQGPACDIGAVERRSVEDYLFNNGFQF